MGNIGGGPSAGALHILYGDAGGGSEAEGSSGGSSSSSSDSSGESDSSESAGDEDDFLEFMEDDESSSSSDDSEGSHDSYTEEEEEANLQEEQDRQQEERDREMRERVQLIHDDKPHNAPRTAEHIDPNAKPKRSGNRRPSAGAERHGSGQREHVTGSMEAARSGSQRRASHRGATRAPPKAVNPNERYPMPDRLDQLLLAHQPPQIKSVSKLRKGRRAFISM